MRQVIYHGGPILTMEAGPAPEALLAAGVAANIRAERLTLEQLAALAGALGESLPLASRGKTV